LHVSGTDLGKETGRPADSICSLPLDLRLMLRQMLAKDPDARYQICRDIINDLDNLHI